MERYILYIVVWMLSVVSMQATAEPMDSLFVHAPSKAVPLVGRLTRLDLLDLYNAGLEARWETELEGVVKMTEKTEDYLRLDLPGGNSWALLVVPRSADTLCVTLTTLLLPEADTEVRLFRSDWTELPAKQPALGWDDFWNPTDSLPAERVEELYLMRGPLHVAWTWDAPRRRFVAEASTQGLPGRERNDMGRCLRKREYTPAELLGE